MQKMIPLSQLPLNKKDWYILVVGSMEQLIGGALSTVAGIMIPLIQLLGKPELTPFAQGVLGSIGLFGIAVGSLVIGKLMDKIGYLFLFRLCPLLITLGSIGVLLSDAAWSLSFFLFIIGLGVGGGYSLDSGYISELVPEHWVGLFVGLAKASCSLGFIGGAGVSYLILLAYPHATVWPWLIVFVGALGLITFLMRIRWYQSPRWLMAKGEVAKAEQAARDFMGPDVEVRQHKNDNAQEGKTWAQMFEGKELKKVILSGIPWACEGLGVYGFGVFLPILVMALGFQGAAETGIPKVMESVKTTTFINIFIGAGFAIGLAVIHKINIYKLMGWCFVACAGALAVLLLGYSWHWPIWISFLSFVIFEVALNAGPHLVTYIVPARIYSIQDRGAGTGIATVCGKIGAVLGVFFMPALLHLGGVSLVLWVSIVVQLIGAAITFIYAKDLGLS